MRIAYPRNRRYGALVAALLCAAIAIAPASIRPAAAGEAWAPVRLFGSSEKPSQDLSQFPKWTGALEQYERERPLELQPCAAGSCAPQRWRKFLDGLKGKSPLQQLEAVNGYVNQTPYQTDMQRFGVVDHWATPREFLGRSGDCEDYALAKYLSLRHLGWRVESIRVLVLNNETRRELHAVLVAYVNGTAYILDNLAPDVQSHAAIRHYRPIFSINEATWYFHEGWSPGTVAAVGLVPQPLVYVSGSYELAPRQSADAPQISSSGHAIQRAATEPDIGQRHSR